MIKIFLTGGHSGIGAACLELLQKNGYLVTAPSRHELDLRDISKIEALSLAEYDIVINCAGTNVGTYLGFHGNSSKNQVDQIQVNFIAPLMLAKNYSKARPNGHFVYISSVSIETPYLYNLFNASAKAGLRYSMDILRKELPEFFVSEVCPGKTKTNMLKQNYGGAKTDLEIAVEYENSCYLNSSQVAECVLIAIEKRLDVVKITPYKQK